MCRSVELVNGICDDMAGCKSLPWQLAGEAPRIAMSRDNPYRSPLTESYRVVSTRSSQNRRRWTIARRRIRWCCIIGSCSLFLVCYLSVSRAWALDNRLPGMLWDRLAIGCYTGIMGSWLVLFLQLAVRVPVTPSVLFKRTSESFALCSVCGMFFATVWLVSYMVF